MEGRQTHEEKVSKEMKKMKRIFPEKYIEKRDVFLKFENLLLAPEDVSILLFRKNDIITSLIIFLFRCNDASICLHVFFFFFNFVATCRF